MVNPQPSSLSLFMHQVPFLSTSLFFSLPVLSSFTHVSVFLFCICSLLFFSHLILSFLFAFLPSLHISYFRFFHSFVFSFRLSVTLFFFKSLSISLSLSLCWVAAEVCQCECTDMLCSNLLPVRSTHTHTHTLTHLLCVC